MYGGCCAECAGSRPGGLGLFVPYGSDQPTAIANAAPPDDPWWQGPVTEVAAALAQRISGPTPAYSPGMPQYGPTSFEAIPAPAPAPAPARAGMSAGTALLLAGAAIGGLKLAGVI